jgi:putative membrane protein
VPNVRCNRTGTLAEHRRIERIGKNVQKLIVASAMLCAVALPVSAQTLQAPTLGAMSATDVGIEPMMRLAAPLYARLALVSEMRTIAAARSAMVHARSSATSAIATEMLREHERALRDLSKIPIAASQLGQARTASNLATGRTRDDPARDFAGVQLGLQRHAWALHSGYASDGRDPALRGFARSAVTLVELDLHRLSMRPMQF